MAAKVEAETYGSEFMEEMTETEQIMDLRLTLRYLGVPINGANYLFGGNKTVVDSSCVPHSRLHKYHQMLSLHHVQEVIAAKLLYSLNPADIHSKA